MEHVMDNAEQGSLNKPTSAMSRIESDVETIKSMVDRADSIRGRIVIHARALGYFEPPKDVAATPMPVITTMADALKALDRALDHASGALNVFD